MDAMQKLAAMSPWLIGMIWVQYLAQVNPEVAMANCWKLEILSTGV
jgi:hypothetical protein